MLNCNLNIAQTMSFSHTLKSHVTQPLIWCYYYSDQRAQINFNVIASSYDRYVHFLPRQVVLHISLHYLSPPLPPGTYTSTTVFPQTYTFSLTLYPPVLQFPPKLPFPFNTHYQQHIIPSPLPRTYFPPQISFSTYLSAPTTPFHYGNSSHSIQQIPFLYLFHTKLLQIQAFQFTTLSNPPHYAALPSIAP